MLNDFCVKFKFGADNNCVSKVYAINTLNNKFLVAYNDCFIWIAVSKCKLYDPVLDDDYDDY